MRRLTACLLLALAAAAAPRAQTASFQGLGILPSDPTVVASSIASGVSPDGSVVVGLGSSGTEPQQAFRWTTATGMTALNGFEAPARALRAEGVSPSGLVVGLGDRTSNTFAQAFTWSAGVPTFLSAPDVVAGWARDVSDTDVVVGVVSTNVREEAFATQGGSVVRLGVPPGGTSQMSAANGVSADGLVVVGRSLGANGWEAFRWTAGTGMVGIGNLPDGSFVSSEAFAASADGQVVVGLSNSAGNSTQAFRWTQADGMAGLGSLSGGSISIAYSVSADGQVVVGTGGDSFNQSVAVVWTAADGMRAVQTRLAALGVDLTGWTLRSAEDVSADGTVLVGFGTNPAGQQEAWRAVLPRTTTATEGAPEVALPRLSVSGNPVTAASTVRVDLPAAGPVRLTLLDALGRTVARLADGAWPAGTRTVALGGRRLASGVYVVRLDAGGTRVSQTVQVVR